MPRNSKARCLGSDNCTAPPKPHLYGRSVCGNHRHVPKAATERRWNKIRPSDRHAISALRNSTPKLGFLNLDTLDTFVGRRMQAGDVNGDLVEVLDNETCVLATSDGFVEVKTNETHPNYDHIIDHSYISDTSHNEYKEISVTSLRAAFEQTSLGLLDRNALEEIADECLAIESLDVRNSDRLDFHEITLKNLHSTLEEVFRRTQIDDTL